MSISPLALTAKKVIDAAWQNGPSYDLASQAAFALESAQLLQSPETAAEHERLRTERDRYRIAWGMARTRAISTGGAADRYAARARDAQEALQHMLFTVIAGQMALKAATDEAAELRSRVAELEAQLAESGRPVDEDPIAYTLTHDCGIPLNRRLECGHCPHEVCQDCDRCPCSCDCAKVQVTALQAILAGQREQTGGA